MNVHTEVSIETLDRRNIHYSSNRPPPNIGEAQVHLGWLTRQVFKIEAKLDYREPEDYQSDKDFSSWKDRASRRLGFYKADKEFLEKWLEREIAEQDRKREAVRREAERVKQEKERLERSKQVAHADAAVGTDLFGMLVRIGREAYHAGILNPQHKAFFEATFVV
jgi:hypothetical protein